HPVVRKSPNSHDQRPSSHTHNPRSPTCGERRHLRTPVATNSSSTCGQGHPAYLLLAHQFASIFIPALTCVGYSGGPHSPINSHAQPTEPLSPLSPCRHSLYSLTQLWDLPLIQDLRCVMNNRFCG